MIKKTSILLSSLLLCGTIQAEDNCTSKNTENHSNIQIGGSTIYYKNLESTENKYSIEDVIIKNQRNTKCYENVSYNFQYNDSRNTYIINDFILNHKEEYISFNGEIREDFLQKIKENKINQKNFINEAFLGIEKGNIFIRNFDGLSNIINELTDSSAVADSYTKIDIYKEGNKIFIPKAFIGSLNNFAYSINGEITFAITENNKISIENSVIDKLNIYGKDRLGFLSFIYPNLKNNNLISFFENTVFKNMIKKSEKEFNYSIKDIPLNNYKHYIEKD